MKDTPPVAPASGTGEDAQIGCTMTLTTREAWELAFILHRFADVIEALGSESRYAVRIARQIAKKVPHGYGETARRILRSDPKYGREKPDGEAQRNSEPTTNEGGPDA